MWTRQNHRPSSSNPHSFSGDASEPHKRSFSIFIIYLLYNSLQHFNLQQNRRFDYPQLFSQHSFSVFTLGTLRFLLCWQNLSSCVNAEAQGTAGQTTWNALKPLSKNPMINCYMIVYYILQSSPFSAISRTRCS